MNTSTKIRHAIDSDINNIVKITRSKKNKKALPFVMNVVLLDAIAQTEKNLLLVAELNNNVVGFVRLYFRNDKIATLHEIAICEDYQQMGIGSLLITKVIDYATNMRMNSIQLKCPENLIKSHNFYKKNGFELIGIISGRKKKLFCFSKNLFSA